MSTNLSSQMLAIRLPETRKRYLKTLATSLGLSLQEAVEQALDMWVSQHQQDAAALPGSWRDSATAQVGPEGQSGRTAPRIRQKDTNYGAK